MRPSIPAVLLAVVLAASGAGCRSVTDPSQRAFGFFRIDPAQPEFTAEEASGIGIRATVTNRSQSRDFYANVGDAFNNAPEPTHIYAAVGTNAVIERRRSDARWEDANFGALFEGSRVIVLRGGRSYDLVGQIAPNSPGTYRIRLDYSAQSDPKTTPLHDYSAAFQVR